MRPDLEFWFGAAVDGADFVVVPELDRYNFEVLPALHTIGHVDPGAAMPLFACDVKIGRASCRERV